MLNLGLKSGVASQRTRQSLNGPPRRRITDTEKETKRACVALWVLPIASVYRTPIAFKTHWIAWSIEDRTGRQRFDRTSFR